ncbi:hypothetical protein AHiyo4_08330 [Arthrobacter sp. Hiyo4]|nr:hypothetical protein AHiyo4_08330 [Arthrobacter sp. Hiyo4]
MGSLVEELMGALGSGQVSTEAELLARYAVDQAPSWISSSPRRWSSQGLWRTCRP